MISVIVPVYNGESYIRRCLDSILDSTCRDLELIVVVNGCRDNTAAVCRDVAHTDSRVIVIETETAGTSHARNLGLDAAKGDYIVFVDGDDYISPVMLEHMLRCAEETGWDIVFAHYIDGTEWQYAFPVETGSRRVYTAEEFLAKSYLSTDLNFVITCNKLFRRAALGDLRYNEQLKIMEDRNYMVKAACRAGSIGRLEEKLYYYWHGVSTSASNNKDAYFRMDHLRSLLDDIAFMEAEFPDQPAYREYAACCLLQNADYRLRDAVKNDLDDIAAEAGPIVDDAARMVRKARHIPKKVRFRLLLEHDWPGLYGLAARVLGK